MLLSSFLLSFDTIPVTDDFDTVSGPIFVSLKLRVIRPRVLLTGIFFPVAIVYPDPVPSFKLFAFYCEGKNSRRLTRAIKEAFKSA